MLLNQIKCTKTNTGKSAMTSGNAYRITLTYKGRKCSFIFNDDYLNESDKKDFLEALLLDANHYQQSETLENFMSLYYDANINYCYYREIQQYQKIFEACKKQHERLYRLFTIEEVKELYDIIYN